MENENQEQWSAETDQVLRLAGWHPSRRVSTAEWEKSLSEHGGFEMHEAARDFLAEFGGLAVDARGSGVTMARMAFRLDPSIAEWEDEIFDVLSEEAGTYLYPVGDLDKRNNYIGVASDGSVYIGMDAVQRLAASPIEALDKLVQGKQ